MADIDLDSAIGENAIEVQLAVDGWQGAVRRAGELLVGAGAAEERYVDAMVNAVDELGPYIVLAPGIAIPHARPEHGGLSVGISVVTLSTPVEFGAGDNDPVDLVFGLATNDTEAHLAALQALAGFIEHDENVEALRNATEPDEIRQLMKD